MSLNGILTTGANGLAAGAFGSSVAGHNITNAHTEGYVRRVAHIEPVGSPQYLQGARARGSTRYADQFLETRLLGARSYQGFAETKARELSVLDHVFSDGPGSVGEAMDRFHAAIGDLTTHPSDRAARQVFLARAESLARAFNQAGDTLSGARQEINDRISNEVNLLNRKLGEIARLGEEVSKAEVIGREASDLRDRRDQFIREVADMIPVKVIEQEGGKVDLFLGGSIQLVSSESGAQLLSTEIDPDTGDLRILSSSAGQLREVSELITGGSIGGLVESRDGAITEIQSQLDQLAFEFVGEYNAVHVAGVGLDGASNRSLFDPLAVQEGAASSVRLSEDVRDNVEAIALAQDADMLPGDNRNALELQALQRTSFALDGQITAHASYGLIVAEAGSSVQETEIDVDYANSSMQQVQTLWDSVSGVSTDEEMVFMMQYQRAYQASLRVIQTADEMFQELINLVP